MPDIEIDAPDGSVVIFDEGTPDAEIERVMRAEYGVQRQRRRDEAGYNDLSGALATVGSFGFRVNEPIAGAIGGVSDVLGAPGRGDLRSMGDVFSEGYERESNRTRAARERFIRERPLVGNFSLGAGAAVPALATAGQATAPMFATGRYAAPRAAAIGSGRAAEEAAARNAISERLSRGGLPGLANRVAHGGAYGGVFGWAAGATNYENDPNVDDLQNWQNRLEAANWSGGMGAGVGAAVPPALAGAGAAGNLGRQAFDGARRALGGVFGRASSSPSVIPSEAIGPIGRMADRGGLLPSQVGDRLAGARANPQGEVLLDVFDRPGVTMGRVYAQSPGRSGQIAEDTATQRVLAASQRIDTALRRALGVNETRSAALSRLERDYAALDQAYDSVLRGRWTAEQERLYQQRIEPLFRDEGEVGRLMRQARDEARSAWDLARANNRVRGDFSSPENRAQMLHRIKGVLGDIFERDAAEHFQRNYSTDTERRAFYRTFANLLDPEGGPPIIPGYRAVTERAGTYHQGRRAIEAGEDFTNMAPEEVDRVMFGERMPDGTRRPGTGMTEFERLHARIGLADTVRRSTQGTVTGSHNPVTVSLQRPEVQRAISAAFDTPEQAAEFIGTLNTQGRLARNALAWTRGSQTFENTSHGMTEAAEALGGAASSTVRGRGMEAVQRALRPAWNALTGPALEGRNSRVGEVLWRRVDDAESYQFASEVERLLAERRVGMAGQTAASAVGSASAGGASQRRRRHQ